MVVQCTGVLANRRNVTLDTLSQLGDNDVPFMFRRRGHRWSLGDRRILVSDEYLVQHKVTPVENGECDRVVLPVEDAGHSSLNTLEDRLDCPTRV